MAGGSLARPQSAEDYLRLFDIRDLDDRPLRVEDVPAVRAARGEAVSGAQIRWYTAGGPKVITVHAARIPAMLGHPETVLIAFDDITALKDAQAQLEEAVRVRQDFLSIAGHELKTPLTSVLLNLRAVDKSLRAGARGDDDPRLAARWHALSRQIGRLEGLVDQLLDVSRITAGKMVLSPERIDLGELVREVVDRFAPPCHGGRHHRGAGRRARDRGSWDRLRLEQILTNLLSNAVKYGAGRPIAVEVGVTGPEATRRSGSPCAITASACRADELGAHLRPLRARRLRRATTAAWGWACGSCGRSSTPWAAASPPRASPTAARRSPAAPAAAAPRSSASLRLRAR